MNKFYNIKNAICAGERKEKGRQRMRRLRRSMAGKSSGIDGLLVTVGLCIIALLLCVVMKDKLEVFIGTIVDALTAKATGILS